MKFFVPSRLRGWLFRQAAAKAETGGLVIVRLAPAGEHLYIRHDLRDDGGRLVGADAGEDCLHAIGVVLRLVCALTRA